MDTGALTRYLAGAYCCFALAILTTVLRLYSRARVVTQVGIDDVFIVVATVLGAAILAMEHSMTTCFRDFLRGNGSSQTMSPTNPAVGRLIEGLRFHYIGSTIYIAEIGFIKLSLLAFYRRFLPENPYYWILYAVGIVTILFVTALTFADIFACRPISGSWDPTRPGVNCPVDIYDTYMANAIFNVITDFVIIAIPIPIVIQLRTDIKKKIALIALFSFGLLGTAITIVRVAIMVQIHRIPPPLVTIWLHKIMNNIMWSEIEISILIFCANLPGVYAILQRQPASGTTGKGSKRPAYHHGYADSHRSSQRRGASVSGGATARSADYDRRMKKETGISASAFGPATTNLKMNNLNSSEELIIQPPQPDEAIHMSTSVVVNVE